MIIDAMAIIMMTHGHHNDHSVYHHYDDHDHNHRYHHYDDHDHDHPVITIMMTHDHDHRNHAL